jgi:hypothetical protein
MNDKRSAFVDEETKHKKKSTSKGQPRAKHKHIYKTVLLTRDYHSNNFQTGRPEVHEYRSVTKVCTICGRIDDVDHDPSYYVNKPCANLPFTAYEKELSEKALRLPKWHCADFFDKFSVKVEDEGDGE